MSQAHSPFKFLDSYQQADADVFFGREKETTDLYNALSGVKHLLVYGPSGAGKTSLIECGLRNQFSDADWFALTIRKGADINASVFASINKALVDKIEINPVTKLPADNEIEFGQAIEKLFAERYQPVYLLFDQFEELLISGEDEEKKKFFTLLNKLIRNKIPCRIMLIMREEFIGHLSEFEPLCPSIFQHRFRVEKMGRKNVEEVIYHILEAPKYKTFFTVDDSKKLTETILSKLPDKKKEIELAHVQVFLGELWDRAQLTKKNNELPVLSAALIQDDDDLEGVLESFLKKQIKELEVDFGERVPLELLAAMISERFTKLQLSEAAISNDLEHKKVVSKKPIAELLKQLEQRRIIRTIKAGDETQYEISHDVLALVVGQNLTEEMKMREKAGDIYKVYLERQGLFTQDDIDYLRPFQQSLAYPPELRTRIGNSIAAIRKQHEQDLIKTRKRLRTVYGLLGAAFIALIAAGYFYYNADKQRNLAQEKTFIAEKEKNKADSSLKIFRIAQAAKETIEFGILKGRANTVLENPDGCPADIVRQMDSIFSIHLFATTSDSTAWKKDIDFIKAKSTNCK
jgi:type II secretory pathway predicted ATPase ExeA